MCTLRESLRRAVLAALMSLRQSLARALLSEAATWASRLADSTCHHNTLSLSPLWDRACTGLTHAALIDSVSHGRLPFLLPFEMTPSLCCIGWSVTGLQRRVLVDIP